MAWRVKALGCVFWLLIPVLAWASEESLPGQAPRPGGLPPPRGGGPGQGLFSQGAPRIRVVYPRKGQVVTARDSTFIFGQVSPPKSQLFINGQPTRVHDNGAFLGWVPVSPGNFVFRLKAIAGGDSAALDWPVRIPHPLEPPLQTDSLYITAGSLWPRQDIVLQWGDILEVAFRGTPGCRAFFQIDGYSLAGQALLFPMAEKNYLSRFYWGQAVFGEEVRRDTLMMGGLYTGVLRIEEPDTLWRRRILFILVGPKGDTLRVRSRARLTVMPSRIPRVVELIQEVTTARTGPGLGYYLFLPQGVRLVVTGKRGNFWRAQLAENEEAWLPDGSFRWLPKGTSLPQSVVSVVRTRRMGRFTRVQIPLQVRLPFRIEQTLQPVSLIVTIWGVTADTDWIRYDFGDPLVGDIRWSQKAKGVYQLRIYLNLKHPWGYNPHYQGNDLLIDIKHPPKISRRSPLKDKIICLDPGHHPDLGAVGPTGLEEREANLAIAYQLKKMLERKGAFVVLTRYGDHGISLMARPKLAAVVGADVLISIHNNALPDGVNPFRNNGSSTYYYHPQSYRLARILQREFLKYLKLPDFGLYYDNLALCRPPQMPAVLVEPAFMMIPEQEALLRTEKFQKRIAKAILKGLEKFFREMRE